MIWFPSASTSANCTPASTRPPVSVLRREKRVQSSRISRIAAHLALRVHHEDAYGLVERVAVRREHLAEGILSGHEENVRQLAVFIRARTIDDLIPAVSHLDERDGYPGPSR